MRQNLQEKQNSNSKQFSCETFIDGKLGVQERQKNLNLVLPHPCWGSLLWLPVAFRIMSDSSNSPHDHAWSGPCLISILTSPSSSSLTGLVSVIQMQGSPSYLQALPLIWMSSLASHFHPILSGWPAYSSGLNLHMTFLKIRQFYILNIYIFICLFLAAMGLRSFTEAGSSL